MPVPIPLLYGELEEVIPALPFGARSRRVCHGGWGPGGGAVTAAGRLSCYCKYEYILITGSSSKHSIWPSYIIIIREARE